MANSIRVELFVPIPRDEAVWSGIDPELAMLVVIDEQGDSSVLLSQLLGRVVGSATFAVVIIVGPFGSLSEESIELRAVESRVVESVHMHLLNRAPSLEMLFAVRAESTTVLAGPQESFDALKEEFVRSLKPADRLRKVSDRGATINLAQTHGPVFSIPQEGDRAAVYGLRDTVLALLPAALPHGNNKP